MNERRQIGEYRVVAGLGSGGMARVFLAMRENAGFTKLLVLKVLRSELDDPGYVEMFLQEARLAARLNHPHVVQTYAFGEDAGRFFMAMEYLEGQPLSAIILKRRREGGIPLELHVRLLCDVLDGLAYAHALTDFDGTPLGIVHRDVSPQNIFVTYTGQAKLLDFGIAKVSDSPMTSTGVIKGKASYMAPEQVKGIAIDGRADTFAIGVMLWEAIANRRFARQGIEDVAVLTQRAEGSEPRIREVVPDAPPELANICDRAIATSRDDRFSSAAEMRDALEAWLRTRPESAEPRKIAALLENEYSEERSRLRRLVDEQVKNVDSSGSFVDLRKQVGFSPAVRQQDTTPIDPNDVRTIVANPPQSHKGRFVLIGALAATLIASAAFLGRRGAFFHAAATAEPAPAKVEDAGPRMISIKLDATPREARISLDGKPLPTNPYSAALPADDAEHELRVEADGYTPESRKVALNADLNVILQLEKTARPQASASAAKPVAQGTRPQPIPHPDPPATATPATSSGTLDWKDPWSK